MTGVEQSQQRRAGKTTLTCPVAALGARGDEKDGFLHGLGTASVDMPDASSDKKG